MKLNIGSGRNKKEGYLNCDISDAQNPDVIFDITKGIPFEEDSIEEIVLHHILEHMQKPIDIMKEIYRVCKHGAIVKIKVPYFSHESAFSMINHYSFFSYTTFDCLDANHKCHWMGIGNFQTIKKRLNWRKGLRFFQWLFNLNPKITRIYQELFCWMIPAKELEVELEVVKCIKK